MKREEEKMLLEMVQALYARAFGATRLGNLLKSYGISPEEQVEEEENEE